MLSSPLKPYIPVCRAISALFPGLVEVVLHDLSTQTVFHIENPFTPRKLGDSSLLETENHVFELDANGLIGPYRKHTPDGSTLKSISALLKDSYGAPVGLMCINMRVDDFEKSSQILKALSHIQGQDSSFLKNDWREMTNTIIAETLSKRQIKMAQAKRADKLAIISQLASAEIFAARGSKEYVAAALGISRANLYQLLRETK